MHATSLRSAKNGIFQRTRLFRFHDGDSAHWFVVNQTRRDAFVSQLVDYALKTTPSHRARASESSLEIEFANRNHARLSRAAGSSILASAAPRRSSFARSSSLARPCSSGSTTPSAGISNCRSRTRTKRALSVTGVRVKGNVTGARIDLDRASRGSTTRDGTRVSCLWSNKPRSDLHRHHRSASFVHARIARVSPRTGWPGAPLIVRHHSSYPLVRRRGVAVCVRTLHEMCASFLVFWNSNRLFCIES